MNIVYLTDDCPPNTVGGAGTVAFHTARELQRRGHVVTIITTVPQFRLAGDIIVQGLNIQRVYSHYHRRLWGLSSLYNPRVVPRVEKLLRLIQPDVVHAHVLFPNLSYGSLRVAAKLGARVFVTLHDVGSFVHYGRKLTTERYLQPENVAVRDSFDYQVTWRDNVRYAGVLFNPLRNLIIRRILRQYPTQVFAVSKALHEALKQNKVIDAQVLYNGIEAQAWDISSEEMEKCKVRDTIPHGKLILFGGRLSMAKGIKQLLASLALVLKQVPSARLIVFGAGERDERNVRLMAKNAGVTQAVHVVGVMGREDLKAMYHVVEVVAVPSVCFDSFPTINLEAMACRRPVVGTCFGGTPEIVQDGVTGFIVNPFNIPMMAARIIELLQNDDKARAMGAAGYERVRTCFSLERQVDVLERNYVSAIDGRKESISSRSTGIFVSTRG